MNPLLAAILTYSLQVTIIVAAATVAEALSRIANPGVRLAWWRVVGLVCLALPLFATSSSSNPPASSLTFITIPADAVVTNSVVTTAAVRTPGTILLWLLFAGVLARLAWLAVGMLRLRELRRNSPIANASADIDRLRLALAPCAEFRTSNRLVRPATFGVNKPIILLPPRFANLDADAQHAVACHELLHVARGDWRWVVAEELARAVFWFHPAIWWLLDRVEANREQLIDQLVTTHVPAKRAYMRALLVFADDSPAVLLSASFLRKRHLRLRLLQLAKEPFMSQRRLTFTVALLMCVTAAAIAVAVRALPLEIPVFAQTERTTQFEIRLAEHAVAPGLLQVVAPEFGEPLYLHPPVVTGENVSSARVIDDGQRRLVEIAFTAQAASRLRVQTQAHVGKPIAIIIDGRIVATPVLRAPIERTAIVSGVTQEEADALARSLSPTSNTRATVYAAEPGVSPPVPIHVKNPSYPPQALLRRVQGEVTLRALVRADGTVEDIRVIRSLDKNEFGLDEQAVAALRESTFQPGTRDGRPVNVLVEVKMMFKLPIG